MGKHLVMIVCCMACAKSAPPPARPAAPGVGSPSASPSSAPAPQVVPPTLVKGSSGGLAVFGLDGKVVTFLSSTPALHPRWTPDHQALVFLSERGELRRFELATGKETVIGTLPAEITLCPGKTIERAKLEIQEDADFAFEEGGQAMCIRLQDRNINMADVIVTYRVELGSGAAEQTIVMSTCKRQPGTTMPDGCRGRLTVARQHAPAARPFAISNGELVHGTTRRTLGEAHDYHEEEISPSGRWVVIGGNREEGDYIHRDLFLFDRDTGALYPLPESAATWPAPIPEADLSKLEAWSERTTGVVGETTILWLGDQDALVIGSTLVVPGVRIVRFEGTLARW